MRLFVGMSRLLIFQPHTPKYLKKLLAVLNIITQFRFRDGTRDKKNVFNNTTNRIKNDRKMNHNHYSLTSLKQPGKYLKTVSLILDFEFFAKLLVFQWVLILLLFSLLINLYFIMNLNVYVKWKILIIIAKLVRKFKSKGLGIYLVVGIDTITLTPLETSFQNCKFDGNGLKIYNILPLFGYWHTHPLPQL